MSSGSFLNPVIHLFSRSVGMERLTKGVSVIAMLALLLSGSVIYHTNASRAERWQELGSLLQGLSPAMPADAAGHAGVFSDHFTGREQIGRVVFADGQLWRFAFRSHHIIGGEESYAVFSGPQGIFRVRGTHFCCEVECSAYPEALADGDAFLAFLRATHPVVERVK